MLLVRILLVTTLLGSALTVQIVYPDAPAYGVLYTFIGLTYLFTIFYSLFYKLLQSTSFYIYMQLIIDALMITILIYFSGGIESRYKLLYTIPIVAAALLLYRKGALILAIVSFFMYGIMLNLLFYEIISHPSIKPMSLVPLNTLIYDLFFHLFVFSTITLLIGYLAETQRQTGRTLEHTSVKLDDLKVFNRNVIDSMNAGLMTTDRNGNIISYNKLAWEIAHKIGKKPDGERVTKFLNIKRNEFGKIKDLLMLNNIHVMEKSFNVKNGHNLVLTFNISILPNSKGEIIGYIFSFQDLTELHKLKDELKMKDKIAALGSMAAAIAHEIRNPLASISGSAQELTLSANLPVHDKTLMNIIVKEAKRLNKIITEYLNFARPHPFTPRETDLAGSIRETILLAIKNPSYRENLHDIEFRSDYDNRKFIGDADSLKQVFWNLILNSLQAMPGGGVLSINLTEKRNPHEIVLAFSDEGSGIPEDKREEVFHPFKTFSGEGFGLGLSIVYRIVDEHGGRVTIKNNVPRGTRIEISLPFKEYDLSHSWKDQRK